MPEITLCRLFPEIVNRQLRAHVHGEDQFIEDVYAREVVMARVGHLIRRKQQEIERITRILRAAASFEGVAAPVSGKILKIVLIGPYARRTWYEDKASLYFSDYEFWVVVNHTLYADETRWCRAKAIIARELGNRCAVSLSVFSKADIKSAKASKDHFILDRLEAGIVLFKASRDAPLPRFKSSERDDVV
ncbi:MULTISPECIES: hypothetical protein [unclassified Sphingomonas]|uniref:hypothetical protein n=1 Tax=unclassified Sphingomonas TaxID=196159 RepID=UPI002151039F|nr:MULTISPECIES: hypothetical protein [unclassified Sphingomonas]MCR5870039.1 hypothetical protein [Sphingomonas sp. J344]UUX98266.1 hypothetical protein LRS08_11755 [Sphingomonas sp. J315]